MTTFFDLASFKSDMAEPSIPTFGLVLEVAGVLPEHRFREELEDRDAHKPQSCCPV